MTAKTGRPFQPRPLALRVPLDLSETALSMGSRRAKESGAIDLTLSNPTRAGLRTTRLAAELLAKADASDYAPDPFGRRAARRAVADTLGLPDEDDIALVASTSEAYSVLFKLLCDAGDEVLIPTPSYPLFEHLAALDSVVAKPYDLSAHDGFRVDGGSLESALSERTRAIVVVAPNNPTGTLIHEDDAELLLEFAETHGLSLIVDEVFEPFLTGDIRGYRRTFRGEERVPTYVLSGLSKLCASPQLKLGWMALSGPDRPRRRAHLGLILDTYLSVGTAIQVALPSILEVAPTIVAELRERLLLNLGALDRTLPAELGVRRLPSHGGWSVVLEIPKLMSEEAWIDHFIRDAGVLAMPGYFFDLTSGRNVVLSLIVPPSEFETGAARLSESLRRAAE